MLLSVIIPTKNRPVFLTALLARLAPQLDAIPGAAELVVVDDGSGPTEAMDTAAAVRRSILDDIGHLFDPSLGARDERRPGACLLALDGLVCGGVLSRASRALRRWSR